MKKNTKILLIALGLGLLSSLCDAQTKPVQPQKQLAAIVPIEIWNTVWQAYTGGLQQLKQNALHDPKLTDGTPHLYN